MDVADVADVDDDDENDKRRVESELGWERVTAERDLCSKSYALMHKLFSLREVVSNVVSYGCIHGKRTYEFNACNTLKL